MWFNRLFFWAAVFPHKVHRNTTLVPISLLATSREMNFFNTLLSLPEQILQLVDVQSFIYGVIQGLLSTIYAVHNWELKKSAHFERFIEEELFSNHIIPSIIRSFFLWFLEMCTFLVFKELNCLPQWSHSYTKLEGKCIDSTWFLASRLLPEVFPQMEHWKPTSHCST